MGIDSTFKGAYVVCVRDSYNPYGRMVEAYHTLKEAQNHIKYQKEKRHNTNHWNILHLKDIEWISYKEAE